jgi:uncharacterized protein YkwD
VKPSVKILATTVSILACASIGALSEAPAALASGPIAVQAGVHHTHAKRTHRGACSSTGPRRTRRTCRSTTHHPRARTRVKVHPTPTSHRVTVPPSSVAPAGAEERAAVAAALSAPCANTELTPEEGNIALVRAAVLCLVNRERAQDGVPPLRLSGQLESAAEGHCSELIADDYFAHVSPSGETPVDRVSANGYIPGPSVGYVIGENLAWGTYGLSTPQSIVAAWIASPGHLANILEAKYTETGVGVTPAVPASLAGGAPGATYAQEFGVIIR